MDASKDASYCIIHEKTIIFCDILAKQTKNQILFSKANLLSKFCTIKATVVELVLTMNNKEALAI